MCARLQPGIVYVWLGAGVNRFEVETSKKVAFKLRRLQSGSMYFTDNSSYRCLCVCVLACLCVLVCVGG